MMRLPAPPIAPSALLPFSYEPRMAPPAAVLAENTAVLSGAAGPDIVSMYMFRPPPVPRSITNAEDVEAIIAKTFPKFKIARCQQRETTEEEASCRRLF